MINLERFCADKFGRAHLQKPFTLGDYTYATNGHIAVRVPKRGEQDSEEHEVIVAALERYFEEGRKSAGPMLPIPDGELPARESQKCVFCQGEGQLDTCPTCDQPCVCPECKGDGKVWLDVVGVEIFRCVVVSSEYLSWIKQLPAPRIRKMRKYETDLHPIYFEFEGGIGVLQSRRPLNHDISLVKKQGAA